MTILATPDVNQQFATERAAQFQAAARAAAAFDQRVADGKLTPLGNGRYRVTDPGSWDNGEVLVRRNGQILPQHGLDLSTGSAALYSTTPAWQRDLHAVFFKHLYRRLADIGRLIIDQTARKQCHLF